MKTAWLANRGAGSQASGTVYVGFGNGTVRQNATESGIGARAVGVAGTFSKMAVYVESNDRTATSSLTFRLNGGNGNQTVSIGAGQTGLFQDSSNTDAVSATDTVAGALVVGSGGTTFIHRGVGIIFDATSDHVGQYCNSGTRNYSTASTTNYFALVANGFPTPTATESDWQILLPVAVTLAKVGIRISANSRTTTTTIKTRVGGADGNISIAIGSGQTGIFEDTSNSDSISAGTLVNFSITTGTGGQTITLAEPTFELTSTAGREIFLGGGAPATYTAATNYYPPFAFAGGQSTDDLGNRSRALLPALYHEGHLRVIANGVSNTSTVSLRSDGSTQTLAVSIGAGQTGTFRDQSNDDALGSGVDVNYLVAVGSGGTSITVMNLGCVAKYAEIVAVGQVTETDLAQAVAPARRYAVGQTTETDTAQAVTQGSAGTPVAQVSEADTAQAITAAKRQTIGQVTESDQSQAITPARQYPVGLVTESDVAQALVVVKRLAIGLVTETDVAQALTSAKRLLLGLVTEVDQANDVTPAAPNIIGQVIETDIAFALSVVKRGLIGQATESDQAQAIASAKRGTVGLVTETDVALGLVAQKRLLLGIATETDLAQLIQPARSYVIGQVTESDLAQPLGVVLIRLIGMATELDMAFAITAAGGIPAVKIISARQAILRTPGMRSAALTTPGLRAARLITAG